MQIRFQNYENIIEHRVGYVLGQFHADLGGLSNTRVQQVLHMLDCYTALRTQQLESAVLTFHSHLIALSCQSVLRN